MHKFDHVEDYIEIIAGYRAPTGKSNYSIFTTGEPLISLARYDMKVVPSLAEQTLDGKGYTDKQAKLAAELVIKYERQLFKHGVDITPVRTPAYRLPLREIDRTSRLWLEDDTLKLKFPYNSEQIEQVREFSKESKGSIQFNRENKYHEIALTEWNLNWVYTFSQTNSFEIDSSVHTLMHLMLASEKIVFKIELTYADDVLSITNASNSLIEYIQTHLGRLTTDNLLRLIDYAPILGYTVADNIASVVVEQFGTRFYSLCNNRQLKVDPTTSINLVKEIAEYARVTNRFPIYVYEPDLSDRLKTEFNKFFPGAMMTLDKKVMDTGITEDVRVVYTTKIPRTAIARIPLLVSSAGMLFGGDRQVWIQTAEKIVYFTNEVYNKNTKGPVVCKLN